MKKIIYQISGVVLLLGVTLASCTKNFEQINTNPNNTPTALPQQLLAPALVNTVGYNMSRNHSFTNELMQVTVNETEADGAVFRYDYHAPTSDYLYNGWYSQLTNFKDIYKFATTLESASKGYAGVSLVCQAWVYSLLTDTYGDVPYFKSNLARDSSIYEPPFDRQKDIYLDLFNKLEQANTLLSSTAAADQLVGNSDPVFGGSNAEWRKFGNSLYLRLLMRLSGKAEVADTCIAKIKDMIDVEASKYPIMTSNTDCAVLRWTGQGPYVSPYLSIREQDWRAVAICSFFIDHLVAWNDPRIDIPTFGTSGINRWAISPVSGVYGGVPSGYQQGTPPVKKSYFLSTTSAFTLMTDPATGIMMNYAEVQFILAEAAAKGWITTGNAGTYYNNGVGSSITYWLPNDTIPVTTYLNNADIQWDDTKSLDDKMEMIHLQKYYALFMVDLQQWFEYRRTGHPILPKGPGLMNGGVMPARMVYPVYVQSTNPTNYKLAVAAQGPDEISTQVWWQKP